MTDIKPMYPEPLTTKQKAVGIVGGASGAAMALALAVTALKPDEGKRNATYLDIAKIPTYCYGHVDYNSKVGAYHTDRECDAFLTSDANVKMEAVEKCTPVLKNRPYQLAAATRLAFNIGQGNYCKSSIARNFNAGNFKLACAGFIAWRNVNGKPVQGLIDRRVRETSMCMTGI